MRAVESKFNEELKPDYVKDIDNYLESTQTHTGDNLKGYKKSEFVLQEMRRQYKQREIEKRQGMKMEEHSKRLANFANEVD